MSRIDIKAAARRLREGDPTTLARAISAIENALPAGRELLTELRHDIGQAHVIGVTGPPGAGKSTLCNALIRAWRKQGRRVGVLAIDPSSPVSGGAILGDRIRMQEHDADSGVFARSVAARGGVGALADSTAAIVDVMDAAGLDLIVIETVGAGQSEVSVAELADTSVVVCVPGLGDDIQAIKAGILEVADILVVNKADLDNAEATFKQLQGMLALRAQDESEVDVLMTSATLGSGVAELVESIDARVSSNAGRRRVQYRAAHLQHALARTAHELVRRHLARLSVEDVERLTAQHSRGELDMHAVLRTILEADGQ